MLSNQRLVRVEFGHCDPSGIVFNPNYFIWFDFSIHALLDRAGFTLKSLRDELGVDGIPLVDIKAQFKAPSRWGDELVIESRIAALHRSAFDVHHVVRIGDTIAVECSETRVWTVFDTEKGRIRAQPIPETIIKAFSETPGA